MVIYGFIVTNDLGNFLVYIKQKLHYKIIIIKQIPLDLIENNTYLIKSNIPINMHIVFLTSLLIKKTVVNFCYTYFINTYFNVQVLKIK